MRDLSKVEILSQELSDGCAFLVTSPVNRQYLTGFNSSEGAVLVTLERCYFFVDSRYIDKARQAVTEGFEVVLLKDFRIQILDALRIHAIRKVIVENAFMTLSTFEKYHEIFHPVKISDESLLSETLSSMRIIKTADEIKNIIDAQAIAERSFDTLIHKIRVGQTEKQIAAMLNFLMLENGADDISFTTIVASGVNSASPHAVPTDKKIVENEFILFDFGAVINGYHSDMTRTIVMGEANDLMKEVYTAVSSANIDAIKAARAGITAKLLDNVARSTLGAWGYGDNFGHGLGHGVGLEIHEAPSVSPKGAITLKEGMVITIEPGVYLTGKFGVRIEDMIVITHEGCHNLTNTPKSLIVI